MSRQKWPKRVPALTSEQQRIRDDFMRYWHEVLPRRYVALDHFNHRWPATTARCGERTLEIGAGLGDHLEAEPDFAKQDYVAVELRSEMAASIRKRDARVEVLVADCQQRMPFDDDSFDRVLAIHVLEHLPDLPSALSEIERVLRPTGRLVAVIPCEGGFAYALARRISAERIFKRRYNMSYRWFVESEHINRPGEIVEECNRHFDLVRRRYFPLRVRVQTLNLVIGLEFVPRFRGRLAEVEPAVGGDDSAERVHVRRSQLRGMVGKSFPCIPRCAEELPGDSVTRRRGEEDGQRSAAFEWSTAGLSLLQRALVEGGTDLLRAGLQHLREQSRVQRAGCDRIHVDPVVSNLLGERFRETHDGRLRRRICAQPR